MAKPIVVPGIPGPKRQLCWKPEPLLVGMARCDRDRDHQWLHSWEAAARIAVLEAELAKMKAALLQLADDLHQLAYPITVTYPDQEPR